MAFRFAIVGTRYWDLSLEAEWLKGEDVHLLRVDQGDPEELAAALGEVDVVLLGSQVRLEGALLRRLKRLRGIVRYGVGVDNVDLEAAEELGVSVAYVPDYCTEEVATHAVALILAGVRRLKEAMRLTEAGRWGVAGLSRPRRFSTLTVGLFGFGQIGQAVAMLLYPFGPTVLAYDPFVPEDVVRSRGALPATKEEILGLADVISLHLPLSPATRHFLGREEFARVRPGLILVNTARGGLVDEEALAAALASGQVAFALLDVLAEEPPDPRHPLLTHPQVLVTPHVAWYSAEAEVELRRKGMEEALRIVRGERPRHPVVVGRG